MAGTIKCEFSQIASTNYLTSGYLRSVGWLSSNGLAQLDEIKIEFVNMPDAISRIVQFSESELRRDPVFTIDAITNQGIALHYIIDFEGKTQEDCFYFVPMHNVACLHTMNYFG